MLMKIVFPITAAVILKWVQNFGSPCGGGFITGIADPAMALRLQMLRPGAPRR